MKYIKYIALAAFFAYGVCSCSEDSLDDQSVLAPRLHKEMNLIYGY